MSNLRSQVENTRRAARGRDRSEIPRQQLARMEERMQQQLAEGQRVPMIRITTHQPLPVVRVVPFNEYQRNRYYR